MKDRDCLCSPGNPCDYHAASCVTCSPRCRGHESQFVQQLRKTNPEMNNDDTLAAYLIKRAKK